MRKIFIMYLFCIIGLFFVPVMFVKEHIIESKGKHENNLDVTHIRVLFSETNEVKTIDLEEYIMGVLIAEMPISYNMEALKAQAVVARTYTLNKLINSPDAHDDADMCDNINHCQAYKTKEYALSCWNDNEENEKWNKIKTAVLETKNEVITYNGMIINAFFHANSGGKTEDISNIWGHENIPYLKSVESKEEPLIERIILTYDEIDKIMKEKYENYGEIVKNKLLTWDNTITRSGENIVLLGNANNLSSNIEILERNSSDRVSKIRISNIILDGTDARSLFGLRSTAFEINQDGNNIIFETKGYGHGIGMSQNGANAMAIQGSDYKDIIKYYYVGVEVNKIS